MQPLSQLISEIFIRYRRAIVTIFVLIIVAATGWVVYFNLFSFSIVSKSPEADRMALTQPIIRITFTQEVSDEGLDVNISPRGVFSSAVPDGKSLIINLNNSLEAGEEYRVLLNAVRSKSGAEIKDYRYTFTPVDNPAFLNKEAIDILLHRQNQKPDILSDVALQKTPLTGDYYSVRSFLDATPDGGGVVRLEVTVFLSRGLIEEMGYANAVETFNAQANQAMKDAGIDIAKYEILYRVQT